ncbi:MAG: replication initiator, partial [Acidimicrobiales bacterium]
MDSFVVQDLVEAARARILAQGGLEGFREAVAHGGYCAHPVRLVGGVNIVDRDSGELQQLFSSSDAIDGVVLKACGNRRATRCPACAQVYRSDTRHLVAAGLQGGKGVPETVADHPAVFVTLTAPSFGAVHSSGVDRGRPCQPGAPGQRCAHGAPVSCFADHQLDDEMIGQALCPKCYRYAEHVIWHVLAPELWRRTTIYLRRCLARTLSIRASELASTVRVSFAKVVEYQARGVIHVHAVIRADGAGDACAPPPSQITAELLAGAVLSAARNASVAYPERPKGLPLRARWGEQVNIRAIDGTDEARRAAAYISKYISKSTETSGALDSQLRPSDLASLDAMGLSDHYRRLVQTAWRLGGRAELEHLGLRRWAHTLGYRRHWLTKSRSYSTTFTALRAARAEHRASQGAAAELDPWGRPSASGASTVIGDWRYVGSGYSDPGDALLASMWAQGAREARRVAWEEITATAD